MISLTYPASANGTTAGPSGIAINDTNSTSWVITGPSNEIERLSPTTGGVLDASTSNVDALTLVNGVIWQQAHPSWAPTTAYWFKWTGSGWSAGQTASPLAGVPSTDGSYIGTPPAGTLGTNVTDQLLVDNQGNVWGLVNGQVTENGVIDKTTDGVQALEIHNGVLWQEAVPSWGNGNDYFFQWTGKTWGTGTLVSPLPEPEVWVGGGNNNASNPTDWLQGHVPQASEGLADILSGTINVHGNDMVNDTLHIAGPEDFIGPTSATTINLFAQPAFNMTVGQGASAITINIENQSRWTGGINTNPFATDSVVNGPGVWQNTNSSIERGLAVNAPVASVGGIFDLAGNHGGTPTLEFMQSVVGQTVYVEGGSYANVPSALKIDDPKDFQSSIQLGFGSIDLKGILASMYQFDGKTLTLYNAANQKVETLNLALDTNPTAHSGGFGATHLGVFQVGSDVVIAGNSQNYNSYTPAAGSIALPIHA
jgi:hypothetical protein